MSVRGPRAFLRAESGSFIIFGLFLFVGMLIVSGVAVDMMRYENVRVHLQNTVDRAVLAAADLDQELDAEAVVTDYFRKAGLEDYLIDVDPEVAINSRIISATAQAPVSSMFLRLIGMNSLNAPAKSTAQETVTDIEISLVLDISGSMASSSKIYNMRNAAKEFVDTVIRADSPNKVSVNIVPYTAQVNAGPLLTSVFPVSMVHSYSHCVDFDSSDFSITGFDPNKTYRQMQHFEASSSSYYDRKIRNPGCPQQSYERIQLMSQNAAALKSVINNYTPRANTAIHIGMKWGTMLLDPQMRPLIAALAADGAVDATFSNRPADWDDAETGKFVVLMTDGENVDTYRITDQYYSQQSHYELWAAYPLYYVLNNYVPYYSRSSYYYRKYSAGQADTLLNNICSAAKAQGIIVYTVSFEVGNHGADVMRRCASAPSYAFRVEGTEISSAFAAIARDINQLKLTQ